MTQQLDDAVAKQLGVRQDEPVLTAPGVGAVTADFPFADNRTPDELRRGHSFQIQPGRPA
ncbi:MAG: hypothetical protein WA652_19595 [Xanthobacteraceae bacterium]